jgi:flagellar basal-body rod protein FlgF
MSQQLFYVALSGLDATMQRATAAANNLANRNTTGFKAARPVFQAEPLYGQGLPDRVASVGRDGSADFRGGAIERTERKLDVAVKGSGWIAVQAPDGSVALTRNGSLSISPLGVLQTSDGNPVLGRGMGPIALPPLQQVTIGEDGTISGAPQGQSPNQTAAVNRIMLADPPTASLRRRDDGLFAVTDGPPQPEAKVRLEAGALEGSNADPMTLMLDMIENTRTYQMQTELMRGVFGSAQGQNSPLTLT